jgi:hypothetical protein
MEKVHGWNSGETGVSYHLEVISGLGDNKFDYKEYLNLKDFLDKLKNNELLEETQEKLLFQLEECLVVHEKRIEYCQRLIDEEKERRIKTLDEVEETSMNEQQITPEQLDAWCESYNKDFLRQSLIAFEQDYVKALIEDRERLKKELEAQIKETAMLKWALDD